MISSLAARLAYAAPVNTVAKVKAVRLTYSESRLVGEHGVEFPTMQAANAFVKAISLTENGCYIKTGFEIEFDNGDVHSGRIDIYVDAYIRETENDDELNTVELQTIDGHVKQYHEFHAGNCPTWMDEDDHRARLNMAARLSNCTVEDIMNESQQWLDSHDLS